MRYILLLITLPLILLCTRLNGELSGSASDTNSGTIAGLILNDDSKYLDSVDIELYRGDTILAKHLVTTAAPMQTMQTSDGSYLFDSLGKGIYSIRVLQQNIALGQDVGIVLDAGAHVTINITINIIINQTFNITVIDSSKTTIVNNFYFVNSPGTVGTTPGGGFVATFPEKDTVPIRMITVTSGVTDTLTIIYVKQPDGSYRSLPLRAGLPVVIDDGATTRPFDGDSISLPPSQPGVPDLKTPINGASGVATKNTVAWSAVATANTYHVQVASDSGFGVIFLADSLLGDTVKNMSGLANNRTYFWRVRGKNTAGAGGWSKVWSFTTIISAPGIPVLASPANGALGQVLAPSLTWATATGAAFYHVQVSTNSAFMSVQVDDSTVATTTKNIATLADSTKYYWRVRSKNSGGISGWSGAWNFTTLYPISTAPINLTDISNWNILAGTAVNQNAKLVVGDNISIGDKIQSKISVSQPFTLVWYGSFPSTTLSYHTMGIIDSAEVNSFAFWTRYQNPGVLGFGVSVNGVPEYTLVPSVTAINNEIKGMYKSVCANDSVTLYYNGAILANQFFPYKGSLHITFSCYERPFVVDSIFIEK